MSSDPTKTIANLCRRMRDISSTIRSNNINTRSLDIPDVLDVSSNLLTSIASMKVSLNDSDRKIKNQREKIDELINQKEHNFIKKMDQKVEKVASRVDQIDKQIKEKESKLSKCLTAAQKLNSQEILKVENDHEIQIQKLNDEFNLQKKKLAEREKVAYIGFEKSLASHLSELSAEWNKKIQEIDDKIASYQKGLHNLIHDKHQQSQIKNEMLMNEDRRMASEHERISIEFRNRKEEVNSKIKNLSDQYQSVQISMKEYSKDAQARINELENKLLNDRKEIEEKRNQDLFELRQKIGFLTSEAEAKKLEIENKRSTISNKVREIEENYEQKFLNEENETRKLIQEESKKIDDHYKPKISKLSIEVQEADLKRAQMLEDLRKAALSDVESGENEVNELNKRNELERNRYTEILKAEKDEYDRIVNEKTQDITELKQENQKKISENLSKLDDEETKQNEEISNLMRQFDDQQKKLSELKRMTLEQRNRKKADELARIEQEHENRKNQILFNISQQIKIDEEKQINESINKENESHSNELSSLQSMLLDIKKRMETLNNKMDDLYNANNQKFQQILDDKDKTLFEDLKKFKNENKEINSSNELKSRIMNETEEVRRRKYIVLREVDQLDQSINELHDDFERKLKSLENQFNESISKIQNDKEQADIKKGKLTNQIDNQKEKINQLEEMAFKKVEETMQFQNSYEQNKEDFKNATEKAYQTNLDIIQKESPLFQEKLDNIRNNLNARIQELQILLKEAKEKSESLSKMLMIEREHSLKEAEEELKLISEEKKKRINEDHMKKVEIMNNELNNAYIEHMKKLKELNDNFDEQYDLNENQFNFLINDLLNEKNDLTEISKALDNQIIELTTKECPKCTEKKEVLRGLIKKRDELGQKLNGLRKVALASEKKMCTLFVQNDQRKTTSALSSLAPKAKILMPKKI